jgi:hypothetical protein
MPLKEHPTRERERELDELLRIRDSKPHLESRGEFFLQREPVPRVRNGMVYAFPEPMTHSDDADMCPAIEAQSFNCAGRVSRKAVGCVDQPDGQ